MKLWFCAAAAATANYAEHSAERLQTQRDKCPWTTAIKNDGGGDEIAYERAPTGLADIFSSMLTAFWYATLARRPDIERRACDVPRASTALTSFG